MRSPVILAVALVLGVIAAIFASRWIGGFGGGGVSVVVASSNIDAGTPIRFNQVRTVSWPAGSVPDGTMSEAKQVIGRIPRTAIVAGEPVNEARLAPANAQGGLSSLITAGKRAITVRVNDVIAVAGFALPGSYVDVLVSAKDSSGAPFSKTVLERVKVLAVAQETAADPTKPKVVNAVTLELTPEESEKLDLARSIGSLSLVLRNEFDNETANSTGARLGDLVRSGAPKVEEAPKKAAPAPKPRPAARVSAPRSQSVQVLRGLKQQEVQP